MSGRDWLFFFNGLIVYGEGDISDFIVFNQYSKPIP